MSNDIFIRSVPDTYAEAFRSIADSDYRRQADLFADLLEQYVEDEAPEGVESVVEMQAERERRQAEEMRDRVEELYDEIDELTHEIEEREARAEELQEQADEMSDDYEDRLRKIVQNLGRIPSPGMRPVEMIADSHGKTQREVHADMKALFEGGDA
jgi:predicted ribosome quality control (RQC) complex YloA/Tae2 family protein